MTKPYKCRVEYLESTGTQYIDTGYSLNTNTDELSIDYTNTSEQNYKWMFGEYESGKLFGITSQNVEEPRFAYRGLITATKEEQYYTRHTLIANSDGLFNDGIQKSSFVSFEGSWNIYLFALNNTGTSVNGYFGYGKIYSYVHKRNGSLIRDFIPVIDNSDRPAMYDQVSGQLFYNQGTGEFNVGPYKLESSNKKLLRKKLALMLLEQEQKKKRPYYCEVEYLKTTGTQYIDTGVPFHFSEDTATLNAELTELKEYQTVYGINERFDGNVQFFAVRQLSTQEKWQGLGVSISWPAYTLNKRFVLQISRVDTTFFQYDGDKKITGSTAANFTDTSISGYIFATHNMTSAAFNCIGKIYSFQHKRGGVLVRDLIPVLDWDMVACMYDKVSGELLYNAGTGEFSYGREIHQVEYLESTGTQYIDTGLCGTLSSTVDVVFGLSTLEQAGSNNGAIFGGRTVQTSNTFTLFYLASTTPQYFRFDYNGQTQVGTSTTMTFDVTSKYNFTYDGSTYKTTNLTTNENVSASKTPPPSINTSNISLFAVNTNGTIGTYFKGRIYTYKYSDGVNSVDFIPAVDENGVGFMFDRVSHTIFENTGTGAFVYPPVELEYLESSGTQYIDTGIIGRSGTLANIDFEWLDGNIGNDKYILGSASTSVRIYFGTYQGKWQYGYFGYLQADGIQANTKYNAEVSWLLGDGYLNINDERIITSGMTDSRTSDLTLYLFARHQGNSIGSWGAIAKIYSCKIYQDDALVRDFIPALKDGQLGMWDKVNEVLYQNDGTGTFIGGKIVESEEE